MRNKWKIGKWKKDNSNWKTFMELKIEGTNICIGHAFPHYQDDNITVVVGRLSNISSKERVMVSKPIDSMTNDELNTAWERSFQQINDKLLR
tara:strand:+ start:40031 stop:40306 length:276 start_codon:yes stop_codon:yes gene_type:complete